MKKIHTGLIGTERRLITLFVGGAFLFLLIFEGFFIMSRSLFENKFSKEMFENEIKRIENPTGGHMMMRGKGKGIGGPKFSGMNSIVVERDGTIVEGQLRGTMPIEEVREMIDQEFLRNLPTKTTQNQESLLFYKSPLPNSVQFRVFIGKSGYSIDDILRDILRFLIMDIFILLPFYFMGKYFVRETLSPIGNNMDAMNHFIHDAGHELKTPLAIISGNLQILRDIKKNDTAIINESISTLHGMSEMLDGLLELSSLKLPKNRAGIPLNEMVNREIDKFKELARARKITIENKIPEGTLLKIDPKHFSLLFSNLLKNAITYNKDGGLVVIKFEKNILSLQDTGIGMDELSKEKIWERFYRVDRSGKNLGSGIGLSIVERIVVLYDWKVRIESALGKGTAFFITTK